MFNKAGRVRKGTHGDNFMILLERRLDNIVYRLGLASTRQQARQLVNHGHILVDGKRVDIPSYEVAVGQEITVREKSQNNVYIQASLDAQAGTLPFVEFNRDEMKGSLVRNPERSELDHEYNESLIVEYYNRLG